MLPNFQFLFRFMQTFLATGSSNPNPLTSYRLQPRLTPGASPATPRRAPPDGWPPEQLRARRRRAVMASRRFRSPHRPTRPTCARHGRLPAADPGAELGRGNPRVRAMAASLLPPDPAVVGAARARPLSVPPRPSCCLAPLWPAGHRNWSLHEQRPRRGLPAGWLPRRRPRRPPELEEALQHFLFFKKFWILV
jgi:hypothetical protein